MYDGTDRECLPLGKSWQESFLQGLLRAHVVIALCSVKALDRVKKADKEGDNLLLEWEIALDKYEIGEAHVLPVLVGLKKVVETKDGDSIAVRRTFFEEFGSADCFPDLYHAHPKSPRRHTIRQIIKTLLSLQAVSRWPEDVGETITSLNRFYKKQETTTKCGESSTVDGLYEGSLQKAYRSFPALERIVPIILVSQEPLSVTALSDFIRLPEKEVRDALRAASGIISMEGGVNVRHKTLTDYLTDPARCKDPTLFVDLASAHTMLAERCLRSLIGSPPYNISALRKVPIDFDTPDLEARIEADLEAQIKARIPDHCSYSAIYWINHLKGGDGPDQNHLLPLVENFLKYEIVGLV
ncbi:hypothetical protein HDV00_007116 [Rhizophlyctis rosea]|nr:hypothetical protein HDV00_007116 [Rhizophlyctis rosea]